VYIIDVKRAQGLIPIVIVIFIAIIAAGLVGMAWYYNQHKDEAVTNTNTNTSTTDTPDWQTYTNDELGVSFKYPSAGNVSITEFNSTQTKDENPYPTTGKAVSISVTFSDKSKIFLTGSSSDYKRIYSESYNGGDDLSAVCVNPGVIENESYCYNTSVSDQDTYKKVYFQAPECSPMFVQESKLNLNKNGYAGLRIHQTLFTNGNWDCTSTTEKFNAVTNSEINRLFSGTNLTEEEKKKLDDFDRFLSSIQLTS